VRRSTGIANGTAKTKEGGLLAGEILSRPPTTISARRKERANRLGGGSGNWLNALDSLTSKFAGPNSAALFQEEALRRKMPRRNRRGVPDVNLLAPNQTELLREKTAKSVKAKGTKILKKNSPTRL